MLFFVFVSDIPRFGDTVAYNVVVEIGFIWLKLGDYLAQNFWKRVYDNYICHNQTLILLITFAGTPPTIVLGATSLVTTVSAATTAPSPTVTPASMVAFEPIQTLIKSQFLSAISQPSPFR